MFRSADLNNIECPDCTFPQFVKKVNHVINITDSIMKQLMFLKLQKKPIVLPKDITPQNVQCVHSKPYPKDPLSVCWGINGVFFF